MASYKVAQDVEADDKLLGPFSVRQFIYLIIVAMAGFIAYGLFRVFPILVVLPLPIIVFFGALALPLRKDQPMEAYFAALISFYIKPRKRIWETEGVESLVEITVPRNAEESRTKDLSENEAERRLAYLADLSDSRGWSIRNIGQASGTSMNGDVFADAIKTEDPLDANSFAAQSFNTMITATDTKRRQELIDRIHQPATPEPTPGTYAIPQQSQPFNSPPVQATPMPTGVFSATQATPVDNIFPPVATAPIVPSANSFSYQATPLASTADVTYNPYPASMHQSVVTPMSEQPAAGPAYQDQSTLTPPAIPTPHPQTVVPYQPPAISVPDPSTDITQNQPSEDPVSPDIIELANNRDLSIETIAHEANRIKSRHHDDDEVVISLR